MSWFAQEFGNVQMVVEWKTCCVDSALRRGQTAVPENVVEGAVAAQSAQLVGSAEEVQFLSNMGKRRRRLPIRETGSPPRNKAS